MLRCRGLVFAVLIVVVVSFALFQFRVRGSGWTIKTRVQNLALSGVSGSSKSKSKSSSWGDNSRSSGSTNSVSGNSSMSNMFWMTTYGLTARMSTLLRDKFGIESHWGEHEVNPNSNKVMDKFILCSGYRYEGNDLTYFQADSIERCAEACVKNADCEVFEKAGSNCYLKFRGKLPAPTDGAESYVKIGTSVNVCPNFKSTRKSQNVTIMNGPMLSFEWYMGGTLIDNIYSLNTVARLAMALDIPLFIPFTYGQEAWLGIEECHYSFCPWDVSGLRKKLTFFTEQDVEEEIGGIKNHPILKKMDTITTRADEKNKNKEQESEFKDFYNSECFVAQKDFFLLHGKKNNNNNKNNIFEHLQQLKKTCPLILLETRSAIFSQTSPFSSSSSSSSTNNEEDLFSFFNFFRPSSFLMQAAKKFLFEQQQKFDIPHPLTSIDIHSNATCEKGESNSEVCEKKAEKQCLSDVEKLIETIAEEGKEKKNKELLKEYKLMCSLFPKNLLELLSPRPKLQDISNYLLKNVEMTKKCEGKKNCGCEMVDGLDFEEGNLRNEPDATAEACCAACRGDSKCKGAVFYEKACWLKNDLSLRKNLTGRVGIIIDKSLQADAKPALLFSSDRSFPQLDTELKSAGGIVIDSSSSVRNGWGPQLAAYQREITRITAKPIKDRYYPDLEAVRNVYAMLFNVAVHIQSDFFIGSPRSTFTPVICLWRGLNKLDDSTICRPTLQLRYCPDASRCPV